MELKGLELPRGAWLVANCGKFPSEKNCKLVIMAPEDQREDLIDAAMAHAVKSHGHQASAQLRQDLDGFLETIQHLLESFPFRRAQITQTGRSFHVRDSSLSIDHRDSAKRG